MSAIVFPLNPTEDQQFTDGNGHLWIFKSGSWVSKSTGLGFGPINLRLETYNLAIKTTNGGNLNESQVFKITNSTSTAKALAFTNTPANRAMTVVVQLIGSAGAVSLPAGSVQAQGVDLTLSTKETFLILFWDGAKFTLTANIKT